MSVVCFPLDAVTGAPSYTGEMLRQALSALCGPAPASRPLGAVSGVRPGTLTTTVTATSSTWTCNSHSGVLDLETSTTAGSYLYAVGTAVTGSVSAADATNPRVDILYVQLSDPAEGDGTTTPQVQVLYLAGTAAASPTAPATPARSMVLAQINVPKSGTGSPSVTWVAPEYGARSFQATQATPTNIADSPSTWVTVPMDTIGYNPGRWSIASSGLSVPAAGWYRVAGMVSIAGASAGLRGVRICNGSTAIDGTTVQNPNAGGSTRIQLTTGLGFAHCAAGDILVLQALQNSGGTLSTVAGSSLVVDRVG